MSVITFIVLIFNWNYPTIKQLLFLFLVAITGTLYHILINKIYKNTELTLITPFTYLSLIWGSLLGYIYFQEIPDLFTWIGGSVIFFSEATTHSAQEWQNSEVDRIPIFNQYNSIGSRFHWWEPPIDLLKKMPPKRQSLFRHAYSEGANTSMETKNLFERPIG